MSQIATAAGMGFVCTGGMYVLLAAGGARAVDFYLLSAFAGLMAAACTIAALSSCAAEEQPCQPPSV